MKNIPLVILEMIDKFQNKKSNLYETRKLNNEFLLEFKDKDPNSDFYFRIIEYKINEKITIEIDRKPQSKRNTKNYREWIDMFELDKKFNNWFLLLKEYEKYE